MRCPKIIVAFVGNQNPPYLRQDSSADIFHHCYGPLPHASFNREELRKNKEGGKNYSTRIVAIYLKCAGENVNIKDLRVPCIYDTKHIFEQITILYQINRIFHYYRSSHTAETILEKMHNKSECGKFYELDYFVLYNVRFLFVERERYRNLTTAGVAWLAEAKTSCSAFSLSP